MVRDAEQTKRRILQAATAEFAEYGIAGARMDRVALAAQSSKERIYAYFGHKADLFDAVFSASITQTLAEVDFDATDLPSYAGRMFDHFVDNPQAQRLATWYRLERGGGEGLPAVLEANQQRLRELTAAQRSGVVTTDFAPVELLALIQAVATAWGSMNPEFARKAAKISRRSRRQAVVSAVARLVAASGGSVSPPS